MKKTYDVEDLKADLDKAGIKTWQQTAKPFFNLQVGTAKVLIEGDTIAIALKTTKTKKAAALKDLGMILTTINMASPIYGFQVMPGIMEVGGTRGKLIVLAYPVVMKPTAEGARQLANVVVKKLGYKS